MIKNNKKIHFAWWFLLGLCIIVGLSKGVVNSGAGLFFTPVSKDLGVGIGSLTIYLSISAIVTLIFLPIGGKLMAKYDSRLILVVAVIFHSGAFALFGMMNSLWGWYVLSVPLAMGGVFTTVIAGPVLINQWFKKHNGLALGIIGAAGGAIGAVTQPAIGNLIANQGWRLGYILTGAAVIIIVVPIILLLIRKSPQEKGLLPLGMMESKDEKKAQAANRGVSFAAAKKSSSFYALALFFFFITSIASFAAHIPTYIINTGYDVKFASNVMAAYMIGVLVGALAFGFLSDKIGAKSTTFLAMGTGLASALLLLFFAANPTILTVALALFGFVTSSIGTLGPALASSLFGDKEYSQIYATASLGLAVSSIIALPFYGYVYDFTGSYNTGLWAIVVMLAINIVLIVVAFNGKTKLEQAGLWD